MAEVQNPPVKPVTQEAPPVVETPATTATSGTDPAKPTAFEALEKDAKKALLKRIANKINSI